MSLTESQRRRRALEVAAGVRAGGRAAKVRIKWEDRTDDVGNHYAVLRWTVGGQRRSQAIGFVSVAQADAMRVAMQDQLKLNQDPPPNAPAWIYAVVVPRLAVIKIGISSSPLRRLQNLLTSLPSWGFMWAKWRGTRAHETAIHTALAEHRLNREWFVAHPDVVRAVLERARPDWARLIENDARWAGPLMEAICSCGGEAARDAQGRVRARAVDVSESIPNLAAPPATAGIAGVLVPAESVQPGVWVLRNPSDTP